MVGQFPWCITDGLLWKRAAENCAKKRKYRTLRGLKAAAKDEWSKIPVEQFQNALSSWSKRVLEIHKAKSRSLPQWKKFQVENCIFEIKPKVRTMLLNQPVMTLYRNVKVVPTERVICFRMGSILFSKMPQVLTDFEVQKIGFDCAPSSASHCNNCASRASVQQSGHPTMFSETKQRRWSIWKAT